MTFKLKDEYIGYLDPFYYLSPESQSAIFQQYEQCFKSKPEVNDIIGDMQGHYQMKTHFCD